MFKFHWMSLSVTCLLISCGGDPELRITSPIPSEVKELETLRFTPRCELDGDAQALSISEDTCGGEVVSGEYVFTPTEEQGGTTCELLVSCQSGELKQATRATISILEVNQPPTLGEDSETMIERTWGQPGRLRIAAQDGDLPAQPLSYKIVADDCMFERLSISDEGEVEFLCAAKVARCEATVEISDGVDAITSKVAINCVNQTPSVKDVAISPAKIGRLGATLTCDYTFEDADGDSDRAVVEWVVNGAVVEVGKTFSSYQRGDAVSCRVTADDSVTKGNTLESGQLVAPAYAEIEAGGDHTCVIKQGALYCWGDNSFGQLGDGTNVSSEAPNLVPGMDSGVTAVAAGGQNTCAIKDGALYCWGFNGAGELGDGTTTSKRSPNLVPGMDSDVTAVSILGAACAIKSRALYCWSTHNKAPGAGDEAILSPAPVSLMQAEVTGISVGAGHYCAIKEGGLYCWGSNADGELGVPLTTRSSAEPIAVPGMTDHIEQVEASFSSTCALSRGVLSCWGANDEGQLGDNTTQGRAMLATPRGMNSGVSAFSHYGDSVCAVKEGELWCWGKNDSKQLGDGSTTNRQVPVLTTGLDDSPVDDITQGERHACAAQGDRVACWGSNFAGQLGQPQGQSFVPSPQAISGLNAVDTLTGKDGSCAIVQGALYTWSEASPIPSVVPGMETNVEHASCGSRHSCAVVSGALYCWGGNSSYQLGDGTTTFRMSPTLVSLMRQDVTAVSVGDGYSCAVKAGALYCWGSSEYGKLGVGDSRSERYPTLVVGMDSGVTSVVTAVDRACALKDGAAFCWGFNYFGLLGLGVTMPDFYNAPVAMPGLDAGVTQLSIGGRFGCAIKDGGLLCWGLNLDRASTLMGDGKTPSAVPTMGENITWVTVNGGAINGHLCAVKLGALFCWGANNVGQIGDGTTTDRKTPTLIPGFSDGVTQVQKGISHTCALRQGQVSCWGGLESGVVPARFESSASAVYVQL